MDDTPRPVPTAPLPSELASGQVTDPDADAPTDEERARRAREQYREQGLPQMPADETVRPHLLGDEPVLGMVAEASVGRVDDETQAVVHVPGPIYVTNRRLLHLGPEATALALPEIAELAMADNRILVTVTGGRGLILEVAEPLQFRVLLAAARNAARGDISEAAA